MTNTEPLEARRLLAGITLITHGYNGDVSGWVRTAAADVQARAGGTNASSIYTMDVERDGSRLKVTSFAPDSGQKAYTATTAAELIIKLDWGSVSGGAYTTGDVAEVVADYLLAKPRRGQPLAELPLHLIGHSRGASLVTALSKNFGEAGVWVDQQTNLDPVPVDGEDDFFGFDFGDTEMATYSNVFFADNYWRSDGNNNNDDFDGQRVPGAYDGDLNSTVQKNFFVSAHGAVTAYYVGTINTTSLDGGDHPVIPSWYGTRTTPARTATGFNYSRIAGGARPLSGIPNQFGGTGEREFVGQEGTQWANVQGLGIRGISTVSAGQTIDARFYVFDRDGRSRVNIVGDTDQNPYNGGYTLLSGRTLSSAVSGSSRIDVATEALKAGNYYLGAYVTDSDGHARWTYSSRRITVETPNFAALANGVLTVNGTSGNDVISVGRGADDVLRVSLNNAVQRFNVMPNTSVRSVVVQAGAGNDEVNAGSLTEPVYVNGGAGFDVINGGEGNDTLSGGAQSDTLTGGPGDDVISGNGGNNLTDGGSGYDRLYSADGSQDTLYGGSNADRFFGGSGNDSMLGGRGNDKMYGNGGNDTILGGDASDLVNGGDGTDTGEDDDNDLRTSIEVIL